MALLERVTTLLRANVNDLIDKAENPEKVLKQLLLDMENQLLQVKTQVAIAIADQHLLEKKKQEHDESAASWHRKAELAVSKGDDDLARAALDRSISHEQSAVGFAQQIEDQRAEAEIMKLNYNRLQQKLQETAVLSEMLAVRQRRARTAGRSVEAVASRNVNAVASTISKLRGSILQQEATNAAGRDVDAALSLDSLEDRFHRMEREDKVQSLLLELKQRRLTA